MGVPFIKGGVGKEICAGDGSKGVSRPSSSWKREENHGKLSLQLKGRGVELVDVARRDNPSTEGESEVEGVFGIGYGYSKWKAMPCSIP